MVDEKSEASVKDEEEHERRLIVAGLAGPPLSSVGLSAPHRLPTRSNRLGLLEIEAAVDLLAYTPEVIVFVGGMWVAAGREADPLAEWVLKEAPREEGLLLIDRFIGEDLPLGSRTAAALRA